MAKTSAEIIKFIEENHPQDEGKIENCCDSLYGFEVKWLTQYIIGVTNSDPLKTDIEHYDTEMKRKLENFSRCVQCIPFHYTGEEKQEMKTALIEVAEHFNAKMDIERKINDLRIPRDGSGHFFIVVTIVRYPVAAY
jgi:hypothetical protein